MQHECNPSGTLTLKKHLTFLKGFHISYLHTLKSVSSFIRFSHGEYGEYPTLKRERKSNFALQESFLIKTAHKKISSSLPLNDNLESFPNPCLHFFIVLF